MIVNKFGIMLDTRPSWKKWLPTMKKEYCTHMVENTAKTNIVKFTMSVASHCLSVEKQNKAER